MSDMDKSLSESDHSQIGIGQRKKLQEDVDSLLARILLKSIAGQDVQDKTMAVMNKVLTEESGAGIMKRISAGLLLRLFPKVLNSLTKNVSPESSAADLGQLLNNLMLLKNSRPATSVAEDQEAADKISNTLESFLSQLDLGEVNEAVAKSHDRVVVIGETMVEMIRSQHLAKVAASAPLTMEAINIGIDIGNKFLAKIYDIPPDLAVALVGGLIDLVDGQALGQFINHKNELIRMLHVGHLLQGDGKTPLLHSTMANKNREVLQELNPELVAKKHIGLSEVKESLDKGMIDALRDYPEIVRTLIETKPLSLNAQIRTAGEALRLLVDLPAADMAQALATAGDNLKTDEISKVVGRFLSLLKTVHQHQPGLVSKLLIEIVKTVDTDDLDAVVEVLAQEVVQGLKPVAAVVMPHLLQGFSELLLTTLDADDNNLSATLSGLFDIFKNSGGK